LALTRKAITYARGGIVISSIGRRLFLTTLASAAGSSLLRPRAARAQQPGKLPTIGFLGAASPSAWSNFVTAFERRLRELGWIEGRTVAIEYRWAEGRPERYAEIAAEFVRLKVNVIVTSGSAVLATKQATAVIPIVFALANDPLGTGMVASLSRPGGNVTGLSEQAPDLAGKRLGLLREVLPGLHRVAIIANAGYSAALLEMGEVEATARTLGLGVARMEIRKAEDVAAAFEALKGGADALYVCTDPLANSNAVRIAALALSSRLPTMADGKVYVEAGGFMSYGANIPELFGRAAEYVDKILHGTKPADIPVEQPTKLELVINLKTAKALGLTVPSALLSRADEVIE
jgi:putative ABC transport system substrate-binding protein